MKIRIIFTVALCLLVLFHLSAQNSTDGTKNLSKKKYFCEGGINLYNLNFTSYNYNYYAYNYYEKSSLQNDFFQGINFKCFLGKNVLRSSFNYYKKQTGTAGWEYYSGSGLAKTGVASIGYERIFRKARFSPYVFSDLSYSYTEAKGNNYYGPYPFYSDYWDPNNSRNGFFTKTSVFGISHGFGLRYNPVKSIVLNLETQVLYYFQFDKDVRNKRTIQYHDFRINPLQLSLAFIF